MKSFTHYFHVKTKMLADFQICISVPLIVLLFSIKVKQDSYRPKYTSSFLICPNQNESQTFKSSRFFFSVYAIDTTCFDKCFLFHLITGRRYFSKSLSLLWNICNLHIVVFFESGVLKEVRILRYLHNNRITVEC